MRSSLAVGSTQGERLCSLEKAKALLEMGAVQASEALLNDVVSSATTAWVEMDLDCLLLQARILFAQGQLPEARRVAEGVVAAQLLSRLQRSGRQSPSLPGRCLRGAGLVDFAQDVLFRSQRSIDSLRRTLPTGEMQMAFLTDKNDVFQSLFVSGSSLVNRPSGSSVWSKLRSHGPLPSLLPSSSAPKQLVSQSLPLASFKFGAA